MGAAPVALRRSEPSAPSEDPPMKKCLPGVLLLGLLLGSDSPTGYDGATGTDGLEGTWGKVEVIYNGQNLGRSGQLFLVIRGRKFTWEGGGPATTGTYTV